MIMVLSLMMTFTLFFLLINHPLIMVMTLIIVSTLVSMISGIMINSFWFSYMLFLIMVGGMLIVFIYMTSVASNEKIIIKYKFFYLFIMIMFLILMNMIYIKNYFSFTTNLKFKMESISMIKFLIIPYMLIILAMIIYLLITLIASVKITKFNLGPLRQKY